MVVRPGAKRPGPKALWNFAGYGLQNMPRAVDALWLELREKEFVHYTVRDVKKSCNVFLALKCDTESTIKVSCGSESHEITLKPCTEMQEICALTLPEGAEYAVRTETTKGSVTIEHVRFE